MTTSEGPGIEVQLKEAAPLNTRNWTPPSAREILAWILSQGQAQADRWSLWSPVAFGCGCASYFALKVEPSLSAILALAGVAIILAAALRRWGRAPVAAALALLLAFAACGVLSGKLQTSAMQGPVSPPLAGVGVEGWVVDLAGRGTTGPRLLIAPTYIRSIPADRLPKRLRITVKDDDVVGPGAAIRFIGLLNPPPPPAAPGAFDFARSAYFIGVGGVGVALKPPQVIDLPSPPWRLALQLRINRARWALTQAIIAQMGQPTGGVAAAMVTGHDYSISQADTNEMRNAGISHILSISGVHMAIVGGFVFFAIRLLISLWPWLAVRVNGKKLAAALALGAIGLYLVVSGAPPPAQRSAITATIAFGAILLDRRAITLRGLGLSALIVLAIQPEAVVEPGFQMSYAATAALIALSEVWPHPMRPINTPLALRILQKAKDWLIAGLAVGVVAGLATAPFAIEHFNRVSLYGLPANLLLEPLSSLVIMPALALGAIAQLFGAGGGLLAVAGWGIDKMLMLARLTAEAPGALQTLPSAPTIALPMAFIGILWLCLWRGPLRWLGLPLALAVNLWPRAPTPDVWISSDGANAAVLASGHPVMLRPDSEKFAAALWARRYGFELPVDADPAHDKLFDCDRRSCAPLSAAPVRLGLWAGRKPPKAEAFARLCASSELVVLRSTAPEGQTCAAPTVLSATDFARGGAVEIRRFPAGWRYRWTADERGVRTWTAGAQLSDSDG
ncbi:MAG TPA: ComEC/Rec2 family competence protein [Caulobacteraceae bacterium]|nr:ComEC/Rec2 family competence protein [Caulobacteraceae bacterium]